MGLVFGADENYKLRHGLYFNQKGPLWIQKIQFQHFSPQICSAVSLNYHLSGWNCAHWWKWLHGCVCYASSTSSQLTQSDREPETSCWGSGLCSAPSALILFKAIYSCGCRTQEKACTLKKSMVFQSKLQQHSSHLPYTSGIQVQASGEGFIFCPRLLS